MIRRLFCAVAVVFLLLASGITYFKVSDDFGMAKKNRWVSLNSPLQRLICPSQINSQDVSETISDPEFDVDQSETKIGGSFASFGSVSSGTITNTDEHSSSIDLSNSNSGIWHKELTSSDNSLLNIASGSESALVFDSSFSQAQGTAGSAGSVVYDTLKGDVAGLATAECSAPDDSIWLLGGGTTKGEYSTLVMVNPYSSNTVVTISVWGSNTNQVNEHNPDGQVTYRSSKEVAVHAGSTKTINLASLTDNQSGIALHLEAKGALIGAYIEYYQIDGLTPQGVDFIMPTKQLSKSAVVNGVSFTASVDWQNTLRLLSTTNAKVNWRLVPDQDTKTTISKMKNPPKLNGSINLSTGRVKDTAIKQTLDNKKSALIPVGVYTLYLQSSAKFLAGVKLCRSKNQASNWADPKSDITWLNSLSDPLKESLLALPRLKEDQHSFNTILNFSSVTGSKDLKQHDLVLQFFNDDGQLLRLVKATIKAGQSLTLNIDKIPNEQVITQTNASGHPAYVQVSTSQSNDSIFYNALVQKDNALAISNLLPISIDASSRSYRIVPAGKL